MSVFDGRDVELRRYEKALVQWNERVLGLVKKRVKDLIASRRRAAKAAGREFALVDDELRVNSASTEAELRATLSFLDCDELRAQEQVFEEARQTVPMPDPPKSLRESNEGELEISAPRGKLHRTDFSDFT